ncbi:MetQ/NlpA family ABC transporter substrate-binding protein [Candidatus Phytoplasma meliae]|uniref:D-methionine transporter substrate-binding protein n=1 Tax=Candidatus Phytoplasma meliae TaxID=1848402 RepID=A0ABS5CY93_9MOLU|nr:MetQ/NlpA family ABC transporter substrate-binding protein [Candidatus Phytoplasma meliae]MBP5835948.1 D-methionine transporter substrate-binding protein [Candidatus Phytoplasma meliae]
MFTFFIPLLQKLKKNILPVVLIISLLLNLLLVYFLWRLDPPQTHPLSFSPKIKVATALPNVRAFLEGSVQKRLKEYHNITLEVLYLPGDSFFQTDSLLANKEVNAKLDAHIHHLNIANSKLKLVDTPNQLTFIQATYLAKFGLFALKDQGFTNVSDLKTFKQTHPHEKLKILISSDNFQKSLSLCVLEQLGIIKKKDSKQALTLQQSFELYPSLFESAPGFPEIEYETAELMEISSQFKNGNYHLCLQYPTLMGNLSNLVQSIATLQKPTDLKDPIYSYTISLVARKDNETSQEIKILQDVLKQDMIIKQAQTDIFKEANYYMIPSQDIDSLSANIKATYLGKTTSAIRNA